jgi:hypothetical protein
LERETDLEIHAEAALRLANQAEVGIVHDYMQAGQLVPRADRELDRDFQGKRERLSNYRSHIRPRCFALENQKRLNKTIGYG